MTTTPLLNVQKKSYARGDARVHHLNQLIIKKKLNYSVKVEKTFSNENLYRNVHDDSEEGKIDGFLKEF